MGNFIARVEFDEPGEGRVDERMVRRAAREKEIRIGGQVEAAGFAIALGKL